MQFQFSQLLFFIMFLHGLVPRDFYSLTRKSWITLKLGNKMEHASRWWWFPSEHPGVNGIHTSTTIVPNTASADAAKVWHRMQPEKLSQKRLRLVSLPLKDKGMIPNPSTKRKRQQKKQPTEIRVDLEGNNQTTIFGGWGLENLSGGVS